jgi:protein-tyrosine phosphatase
VSSYLRAQWRRFFGLNLSPVTPLLYVGGQFEPAQWPAIHALGVRAVLSLQAEREDRFAGPAPERALRLLVVDFTPPSVEQLDEGARFIADAHAAGLPVLVHCHAGVGRAPLAAAAYLMASEAAGHGAALARVRAARPIIGPNPAQVDALRAYEGLLRARGRAAG